MTRSSLCKHPPRIQHEGEVGPIHIGEGQQAVVDVDAEDAAHLLLSSEDPHVQLGELFLDLLSQRLIGHDHGVLTDGAHDRVA